MNEKENITPVTEDEADNIRVTLELDNGTVECRILLIFDAGESEYIALMPLDKNGNDNEKGEVYIYRYHEDEKGIPSVTYIEDEEEYEIAADRFDEILDEELYDEMPDETN